MPSNLIVGVKPDTDNSPLLTLARSLAAPSASITLVTLVAVANEHDELHRIRAAEDALQDGAQALRRAGFDAEVVVLPCATSIGAELARFAGDRSADLLVMGLTKRSRVGKALLGSDAQSALLMAECPVVLQRTG